MFSYEILLQFLIFIVSLYLLVKFSDYFTMSSYKIGIKFGWKEFVIGVLIMSIGTSLPELTVTIISAFKKESGILIGNILGSNISNTLLILGISFIFAKGRHINKNLKDTDLPLYFMLTVLLVSLSIDKILSWIDGIFLLASFVVYLVYAKDIRKDEDNKEILKISNKISLWKEIVILLISIVVVFISSDFVVSSIKELSEFFSVPSSVISAIILAVGTSLPELFVSVHAARRGMLDASLGNIIGSNIFNISFILGIGSLISSIKYDFISYYFLLPSLVFSVFVILEIFETKKITKYEGVMMLLLYCAYVMLLLEYI